MTEAERGPSSIREYSPNTSFFDNLGDKTIYDDFTITVKIATMEDKTASL